MQASIPHPRLVPTRRLRLLAAALGFVGAGCSTGDTSGPPVQPLQLGALTITISGVPGGSQATVTISGPGGSQVVHSSGTITGLAAGSYTISAADISSDGSMYAPSPATQAATVEAGRTTNVPGITYALATGLMAVTITGLPQGTPGIVTVTGPGGFTANLPASATLNNLAPGEYTVTAANVTVGAHIYAPPQAQQAINVAASLTPASAPVPYALASGLISLTINGLPGGTEASVVVTGPNGYSQPLTGTALLSGLASGAYTISAGPVLVGSTTYEPTPASQGINITPSIVAVPATVTYAPSVGSLSVSISGLPNGVNASVTVTGPNGSSANLTASQTLQVGVGTYTIAAAGVSSGGTDYSPSPVSQQAAVAPNATTDVTVLYTGVAAAGLNLVIDGAYITQSVQTYSNSVPLVAGRDALLRVFVKASEANNAQPSVRVRFYNGVTLVNTLSINAPSGSVPLSITEGTLTSSWNLTLPGSSLTPGLSMLIDVDPGGAVAESIEGDNSWPVSGTPAPLDVRTLSTLGITFVPIHQMVNGRMGDVSDANKATFLTPLRKMLPVATVDADVHATFSTAAGELASNGGNWSTVLSEINALRISEGTGRYYYGVVDVGYTSGVAGLGYIGVPAALGWDYLPGGSEVMAHELGHNFGRLHAPCGGPSGVDGSYPYPGAVIGYYGYDNVTGQLRAPTQKDFMSYCDPSWISDYNYNAILNFRQAHPDMSSAPVLMGSRRTHRSILVWGRIEGGQAILEPAFEIDAPPSLPRLPGPHRIEGFGVGGEVLFSLAFEGERVAELGDPDDRMFAFAVPESMLRGGTLSRLRLTSSGREAERRASTATAPAAAPTMARLAAGRARLSWSPAAAGALVRNARTGQVLAISRGATIDLPVGTDELDVIVSDGVRSSRSRIRPQ